MDAEPVGGLARVLDATGTLVDGVGDDQWADPTPCPDWNVADLVRHIISGNRLFAVILNGEQPGTPGGSPPAGFAPPGSSELPGAYRDATAGLLSAFSRPGVLEETFTVPFGTVPGSVALHLRITELLVHGWDLARATGQPAPCPGDLAEQELAFSRRALTGLPPGRNPFGPPQPAGEEAAPIDRLAALLGRTLTAGSEPGAGS